MSDDVAVKVTFNADNIDTETNPLSFDPSSRSVQGPGTITLTLTTQNGNGTLASFSQAPISFPQGGPFGVVDQIRVNDDNPLVSGDAAATFPYTVVVEFGARTFISSDPVIVNEPPAGPVVG